MVPMCKICTLTLLKMIESINFIILKLSLAKIPVQIILIFIPLLQLHALM